ncbi:hypothetical protein L798_02075 [Zootermopsis nevadensis]|uniref:Uncharacterized protein n=1 Tax=Zootermopsis nevadensis TaxID=136037 RepID=A0A067REC8_ZOONE|nr:hypothetical protein L798_02075 [Zootermopsis nevadensis]
MSGPSGFRRGTTSQPPGRRPKCPDGATARWCRRLRPSCRRTRNSPGRKPGNRRVTCSEGLMSPSSVAVYATRSTRS